MAGQIGLADIGLGLGDQLGQPAAVDDMHQAFSE